MTLVTGPLGDRFWLRMGWESESGRSQTMSEKRALCLDCAGRKHHFKTCLICGECVLGLTGAPGPQLQRVWSLQGNSQDSVSSCVLRQGISCFYSWVATTPEYYSFQAIPLLPLPIWGYRHTTRNRTWAARLTGAAWLMLLPPEPFPHP